MVQGIPYVHWKIKDTVDLTEIDPVYLWGTVIESDKGPINTPVFCTNAEQVKNIFNYDLRPFFVNGGRSVVIVRAYAGEPKTAKFDFELSEAFKYVYVDYQYYDDEDDTSIKAKVNVKTETIDSEKPKPHAEHYTLDQTSAPSGATECFVRFSDGRWRVCDANGNIQHFYIETTTTPGSTEGEEPTVTTTKKVAVVDKDGKYYPEGTTLDSNGAVAANTATLPATTTIFIQSFNESDVTKLKTAKVMDIEEGTAVLTLETIYPGDFYIPVSVKKDIRSGYRVSVKESDDYTILLSGATTLEIIEKRINERATNIQAKITASGKDVEKPFKSVLIAIPKDAEGNYTLPNVEESNVVAAYTEYINEKNSPVGSIFAKVPKDADDTTDFAFKLVETVSNLSDGSNGVWNKNVYRISDPSTLQGKQTIAAAHKEALDHLATIKLSGIFCNYGEDSIQKVYADHVSTTEPEGMNSAEVCRWRTLILGANAFDRTNDDGDTSGFKLVDKSVSLDNENILFLGQGLIDDGYAPESNLMKKEDDMIVSSEYRNDTYIPLLAEDQAALPNQLLPFQCTQYVAGLRSKLFYGDAIFGGEAKKEIVGVGNLSIAPLFAGENKLLWQPDNYATLNEYGVLTFTTDYNILSLTDGITTKQTPLEEDEEGVQSIVKYAKHIVHEDLQRFIGRNLTGDLEQVMENSVKALLGQMQTQDQTLVAVPSEGLPAYDVDIVLVPKSNAQQLLAKAYVYLKLTPVHALRQIEVELTVQ